MKNLLKIINATLLMLFVINSTFSQQVMLDSKFGKKGKIKIKNVAVRNLFYDANSKFIFITSNEIINDAHSTGITRFKDGLQKINIITGDHDPGFGKNGKVEHTVNSNSGINIQNDSYRWTSSVNNITLINQRTTDKEWLIFNKEDGKISTFPRPDEDYEFFYLRGIYFEESSNKFWGVDNQNIFWYDADRNEKLIHNFDMASYSHPAIQNKDGKFLIPFSLVDKESLKSKWNFLSIENDEISLNAATYETEPRIKLEVWNDHTSVMIQRLNDHLTKCRFYPFEVDENWKTIEYASNNKIGNYTRFIGVGDDILYGYETEQSNSKPISMGIGLSVSRILSENYKLVKLDFTNGQVIRVDLSNILPKNKSIFDLKHIGNDEFIILAKPRKQKRGKRKYFLYKVILK